MLSPGAAYDKTPSVSVASDSCGCSVGWEGILARIRAAIAPGPYVLCVECYPGVFDREIADAFAQALRPQRTIFAEECFYPPAALERMLSPWLTDDPVFGRMAPLELSEFFDPARLRTCRRSFDQASGLVLIVGPGASLVAERWNLLVYCDLSRWEIQQRQRRGESGNLGADNASEGSQPKYKRGYFVDWRAADRLKTRLFDSIDFLLDTHDGARPKLISGEMFRRGLEVAVQRPFRVVPFFDPGPWGGEWMRRTFDLPQEAPNFAWCFDCVPEENSLLLGFGSERIEVPAIDLVLRHPRELLGERVHLAFGAEFPIRFDLLDTMEGGNLSLQVHPLKAYIREHFGMAYTQDESYYLLDAAADAVVYLGLRDGVDRQEMKEALQAAQTDGCPFAAERYVARWPARKHDHLSIPAGTIHCSGRHSMVLEVSATPYIFTFKLWDWGRMGLNGEPRPIHLEHGLQNVQWNRTADWVSRELIGRVEAVASGAGWTEERTGLHPLEFIETRRHWFQAPVPHDTGGTVNVVNLVEGSEAVVESPDGRFDPFLVHYAETFIVPAAVGPYTVRPRTQNGSRLGTLKAFVRNGI
ncbi:MAG TPA: class I mannose-6-phosphate isomerase [Bryobacteraceae bacterium]|nr:class I mannose-6-phosphate isomerase [Bryobacteraceae bacterium]